MEKYKYSTEYIDFLILVELKLDKKYYQKWEYGLLEGFLLGLICLVSGAYILSPMIFIGHELLQFWSFFGVYLVLFANIFVYYLFLQKRKEVKIIPSGKHPGRPKGSKNRPKEEKQNDA